MQNKKRSLQDDKKKRIISKKLLSITMAIAFAVLAIGGSFTAGMFLGRNNTPIGADASFTGHQMVVGDFIQGFGRDPDTGAPLTLRVIDINDNGILVRTDRALAEERAFDAPRTGRPQVLNSQIQQVGTLTAAYDARNTWGSNFWGHPQRDAEGMGSDIRNFLNTTFYNQFTPAERNAILTVSQRQLLWAGDVVNSYDSTNTGTRVNVLNHQPMLTGLGTVRGEGVHGWNVGVSNVLNLGAGGTWLGNAEGTHVGYDDAWYFMMNDRIFLPSISQVYTIFDHGLLNYNGDCYRIVLNSANTERISLTRTPHTGISVGGRSVRVITAFTGIFDGNLAMSARAITPTFYICPSTIFTSRVASTAEEGMQTGFHVFGGFNDGVTVRFDIGNRAREAGGVTPNNLVIAQGNNLGALPTGDSFAMPNFEFLGWFTAPQGTAGAQQAQSNWTILDDGDITLYAWFRGSFVVEFDLAGGFYDGVSQTNGRPNNWIVETGEYMDGLPTPHKPMHEFLGWFTGVAGTGVLVDDEFSVDFDGDVVLFAHWALDSWISISFNLNFAGATNHPLSQNIDLMSLAPQTILLPTVTRPGHVFAGWWTTAAVGGEEITLASPPPTQSMTLFARWNLGALISFDLDGGTLAASSPSADPRQLIGSANIGALPVLENEATRVFAGWVNPSAPNVLIIASATFGANVTLVPRWQGVDVDIEFNAMTGYAGDDMTGITRYNERLGFLPSMPMRVEASGTYIFMGWFSEAVGGVRIWGNEIVGGTGIGGDADNAVVLFARWQRVGNVNWGQGS